MDISENAPTTTDRILGCLRAFTTRYRLRISIILYDPHGIEALLIEITVQIQYYYDQEWSHQIRPISG